MYVQTEGQNQSQMEIDDDVTLEPNSEPTQREDDLTLEPVSPVEKALGIHPIQRVILKCLPLLDLKNLRVVNKEWNQLASHIILKRRPFPIRPLQFYLHTHPKHPEKLEQKMEYALVYEEEEPEQKKGDNEKPGPSSQGQPSTSTPKPKPRPKQKKIKMSLNYLSNTIKNSESDFLPQLLSTLTIIGGKLGHTSFYCKEMPGLQELLEENKAGKNITTLILSQVHPIPKYFKWILLDWCPNIQKLSLDLDNTNQQSVYNRLHFYSRELPSLEWFQIGRVDELALFPNYILKHAINLKGIGFSRAWIDQSPSFESWLAPQYLRLIKEFHYSPGKNSRTLQLLSNDKHEVKLNIFSALKLENTEADGDAVSNPNPIANLNVIQNPNALPEMLYQDARTIRKILQASADSLRVLHWDFGINSQAQMDFMPRVKFLRMEKLELVVQNSRELKFDAVKIKGHFPNLKVLLLKFKNQANDAVNGQNGQNAEEMEVDEEEIREAEWLDYFVLSKSFIVTFDLVEELQIGGMSIPENWLTIHFPALCPKVKKLWIFPEATSVSQLFELEFFCIVKQLDKIFHNWSTLEVVQFAANKADIQIKKKDYRERKRICLKIMEKGLERLRFDPERGDSDLKCPLEVPELFIYNYDLPGAPST